MALINGQVVHTSNEVNYKDNSIYGLHQYSNNLHYTAGALDKYLCDTIEQSLASIDKALTVKDYGLCNQKLRIYG